MRIGRVAGATDTGRRRVRNEDAYVCAPPLFAVADGMGGARAGEIAARLAAAALEEVDAGALGQDGMEALIAEANRRIWERAVSDPTTAGMGTTVTAALVDAARGHVTVGHVGDSRAYLVRGDSLEQLTTDHSLVAELVQSGVLTPEEAERHPQRSAITRALGTEPTVEVESFTVEAIPGDLFLLCSDGLSVMLADGEILEAIDRSERDPAAAADALVAAANARGGEDNVTVVLFELVEGEARDGEALSVSMTTTDRAESVPLERTEPAADGDLRTHGAGPGGRAAALLLVVGLVALALLVLYLAVAR